MAHAWRHQQACPEAAPRVKVRPDPLRGEQGHLASGAPCVPADPECNPEREGREIFREGARTTTRRKALEKKVNKSKTRQDKKKKN
jgi:hypothetical protein